MIKKIAWLGIFGVIFLSCLDKPDCFNLNNNEVGISFAKMFDRKADTVRIIGVTILGSDSIFYPLTESNGVFMPFNFLADQSQIAFHWLDDNSVEHWDTLLVGYLSRPQYVSEECGERYVLSDISILESTFDSARVILAKPEPNKFRTTSIVVYRCPQNNQMKITFRQLGTHTADSVGAKINVDLSQVDMNYSIPSMEYLQSFSSYELPMNVNSTNTTYTLTFPSEVRSFSIGYMGSDSTLFESCGNSRLLHSLSILSHDFPNSKVEVVNDSIYDPPKTNIHIAKCPPTNLLKLNFKESLTSSGVKQWLVGKIVPAYSVADSVVFNRLTSSAEIPLDTTSNSSTFTIEFDDVNKDFQVQYTRTWRTIHEVCSSHKISDVTVVPLNFSDAKVAKDSVTYPTIVNIELVK